MISTLFCKQSISSILVCVFLPVFFCCFTQLAVPRRSETRRFIALVDELYRYRVKLVCTAARPLNQLFAYEELTAVRRHQSFLFVFICCRLIILNMLGWKMEGEDSSCA